MKPFGPIEACETLWPQERTLRISAASITTLGLSTWQATTSQPASASELTASASRTGSDHSPVKITCTVALGFTLRAPGGKELMVGSTTGMGLAATRPSLLDFVDRPAAMPSM